MLFYCHSDSESFAFYTDRDTITLMLIPDKFYKFYVSLNDTAYALTVVRGAKPKHVQFETKTQDSELKFWYEQNKSNEYLNLLRSKYPIDSLIANTKSDTEKALKILHWVHNQWQHDGSNQAQKSDAISILDEAREGINFRCVEYGIVATTCLNAIGLKARTLGLMPRDVETSKYAAGHVLLEVYLDDLKKWALLDGQWDAVPVLNNIPLNAVEFHMAIVKDYEELNISTSSGISKRHYIDWIFPYLYYFTIPFDNREGTNPVTKEIKGNSHLMVVPPGAKQPAVFQCTTQIDYCLYTNSLSEFFAPPVHHNK